MLNDDPASIESLNPETTALIVVDVQRGFTGPDMAQQRLPNVRALAELARDAGLMVVFTRSYRRDDGTDSAQEVYDIVPEAFRRDEITCRAGTADVEFEIEPRTDEYTIEKQRYDAFHGTRLDYYLRAEGVDTLLMCGVNTNVCVDSTARGGHERGYNLVFVEDCCASSKRELHEASLRNFESILGPVVTREAVAELLGAVKPR